MGNKFFYIIIVLFLLLIFSNWAIQENTPPKVEIVAPDENARFQWNSIVPYSIRVSDEEDGNSEYQEINSHEVILSAVYVQDTAKTQQYINDVATRSEILSLMATSDCLTCHKAKDNLIGPSFVQIVTKYSETPETKEYLKQKINDGSTGVWGAQIMPAQPGLEAAEIMQMLDWIFKNARDSNFTFYTGTEGAFRIKERPMEENKRGVYILHAQYADHGLKESHEKSKKGTSTLVLKGE